MPLNLYPGSVFSSVVDATAARVATAVEAAFPGTPTFRRKKPVLLEIDMPVGGQFKGCVLVSPGADGPRIVFETFGRGIAYGYPVAVVAIFPSNAIFTAIESRFDPTAETTEREYADVMLVTEAVRQAVYKPYLDGVPTVFNADVTLAPAFEGTGANSKLYAVSGLVVTYHSIESRAA